MVALNFECLGARAERYAAAPTLVFKVRVKGDPELAVHAVALRCQIRIEPQLRRYGEREGVRLNDLFGERSRWADTLKPLQFAMISTMVPGFTGHADVDLTVPCTYDLEVAAARYFASLDGGEVPLLLLFSGTVFVRTEHGFEVAQIPWSSESAYRMPVAVWREMVDLYFPDRAWIGLSRDTLDVLGQYKTKNALPTWDATLQALLKVAADES